MIIKPESCSLGIKLESIPESRDEFLIFTIPHFDPAPALSIVDPRVKLHSFSLSAHRGHMKWRYYPNCDHSRIETDT